MNLSEQLKIITKQLRSATLNEKKMRFQKVAKILYKFQCELDREIFESEFYFTGIS